jgi:nucleoid-associated protein YgaU
MIITAQRILLFLVGLLGAWLLVGYFGGYYPRGIDRDMPHVARSDDGAAGTAADGTSESWGDWFSNWSTGWTSGLAGLSSSFTGWTSGGESDTAEEDVAAELVEEAPEEEVVEEAPEEEVVEAAPEDTTEFAVDATEDTATGDGAADTATVSLDVIVPTFDVLRVESDGSLVIAGKGAPSSTIEIVEGSKVLASTEAASNGDFASTLSLEPGEHTLVLRSTTDDGSATSLETAIVSVPSSPDGEVVALVQQPGEPSRLITVPEPEPEQKIAETEEDDSGFLSWPPPLQEGEYRKGEPPAPAASRQQAAPKVAERKSGAPHIAAVEIDGKEIFVAGQAEPEKLVRIYANDVLLGQAEADRDGRFLIETERELAVGDYLIRADVLGADEQTVMARAAVPFVREPGDNVTSVAGENSGEASGGWLAGWTGSGDPEMGAPLQPDRAVIIRKGDTLWHISRRIYGHGTRYTTIYQANKEQIRDPDMIWPGQTFVLPENGN